MVHSAHEDAALKRLSRKRWRQALALTAAMLIIYFGFILLTALAKPVMGMQLGTGLSVGILLGAIVIVSAFLLTGIYVRWANTHYDPELRAVRERLRIADEADAAAARPVGGR